MSAQTPVAAALMLARALQEADELGARKVMSGAAWKGETGTRVRELLRAGWRLHVEPTGKTLGGRAVVRATGVDGSDAERDRRFVLLARQKAAWRVVGLTDSQRHAWIFLDDRIAADPAFTPWEDVTAVASHLVEGLRNDTGEPLKVALPPDHPYARILTDVRGLVLDRGLHPSLGEVRALRSVGRALVQLLFAGDEPAERWLVYGTNEIAPGPVLLIEASGPHDLDALLTDLEPTWAELETPMSDDNKKKLTPEEAKDLVNTVVVQAMKEMGYEQEGDSPDFSGVAEGDLKGKIPELVYNLLQSAISKQTDPGAAAAGVAPEPAAPAAAPAAPESPVVDLQEERKKREPREPSAFEKNISASLSGAVSGYMADHVVGDDDSEVKVDADFLKDHGPKLFANLFGAFVKSIVPEDLKIDVPVTTSDEDGSREVKMKLDVSEMLHKVFEPVQQAAERMGQGDAAETDPASDGEEDQS